jgi:integral membrane protein
MGHSYDKKIESARFFTEKEAWNLFRLAAFGEAFGWTLLISSLIFKHYVTPGNNIPIDIAGQIHGTLFLIYIAAVVVLHPSLHWSPRRTLIAGLVSVPPYGTLIFEQWAAHQRRNEALRNYRQVIVRGLIVNKDKLLVLQPKESGFWYPPGGQVKTNESVEQALRRIIMEQTGIKPAIGRLVYVSQHHTKQIPQIELFFSVKNNPNYRSVDLAAIKKTHRDVDEISFINPSQNIDLRPKFLQTKNLPKALTATNHKVIFLDD